ncbi:unnamed protein product [Rotaria sordida]|uniref:mitogen-activated protein kinase kinase n=1 Tax=Rotaria sordida TaxID=392033 RepID=A0A819KHU5_9BILA|nr:unnamed protein product [Rotaria sordida]
MEEQNVSEPNQNTTLAEEEQLYLQAAFLSDVMQILNPVIDNVENEYMQPVLLDTASLFIDRELPQTAEYVEDVSNTFGATQPITTNDTMRLDKTPNKTTTRKQIIHSLSLTKIASALEFLAQKNYLHRDIKPDNILLSILGFFKLSDFGTCCEINETNSVQSGLMGTIAYFSPELVKVPSKPSSIQSDMWALGITLLEIVIGKHPCLASNDSDQYLKIATWNPEVPTMIIFDYMQKFILYLLKKESEQRPGSYIEILNMSFIRDLSEQPTNDECNFVADVMQISYECTG